MSSTTIANVSLTYESISINSYSNSAQSIFETLITPETINVSVNTTTNIQNYAIAAAVNTAIAIAAVQIAVSQNVLNNTYTHIITPVAGGPSYTINIPYINAMVQSGIPLIPATQLFNFLNFSGSPAVQPTSAVTISGNVVNMTTGQSHNGGGLWYKPGVQNIQSFTTDFTFVIPVQGNYGFVFCIQNSNSTTNPFDPGIEGGGNSANGLGYGAGGTAAQPAMGNSIGLVFSCSNFNNSATTWFVEPPPISYVLLCVDGGPAIGTNSPASGYAPAIDLRPFNLNIASGNLIHAFVTYDGTILTLVLTDTGTGATTRMSWTVNIPAIVGANTAFIGFCDSQPDTTGVPNTLNSWKWLTGIATRLPEPIFSVAAGQYTGTQTVSLSAAPGASIYYTINGMPPTTSSTLYTGTPITVSSSQVISAVAVQTGYTDSFVAQALYLIQAAATPIVNFPTGFANSNGLIQPVGYSSIAANGNLILVDANVNQQFESAAAWFDVPVPISTFSTNFTIDTSTVGTSFINGVCFVLQNYPQTNTGTNFNWNLGNGPFGITVVSGGPWTLSAPGDNLGYFQIFNSVCVTFMASNNTVGLYTNGVEPITSQVSCSPINFTSTTPINVTLAYNGTALTLAMTQGASTFNLTLSSSINIPSIVGANMAYPGFTASTNYAVSNIQISKWTM